MKVLSFSLVLTLFTALTAFEVNKIEGIEGEVSNILFDSDFNIFVVTSDSENLGLNRIYKLDPERNVIFSTNTTDYIFKTFINYRGDFYTINWLPGYFTSINTIRAGNSLLEKIITVSSLLDAHEDDRGNLIFFSTQGNPGVFFLNYNTSKITSVKNLANFFCVRKSCAVITDDDGNTYLEGSCWNDTIGPLNQFAVIGAESKEKIPEGRIIEGILDDPTRDYVEMLALSSNNELLISVTDLLSTGYLKSLTNGTVSTIFSNEVYQHYFLRPGKTRIVINSCNWKMGFGCRFSYLTGNGEVVQISNLQNQNYAKAMNYGIEIDEEGNIFVSGNDIVDQSTLEFLNSTETTTIGVDFGDFQSVFDMKLDGNGNLWALTTDGIYFIEKGTMKPEKVINETTNWIGLFVNSKKRTSEVFFADETGLYGISN